MHDRRNRLTALPSRVREIDIRSAKPGPKRADPFYLSAEWRKLMAEIIAERGPALLARQGHLCEDRECQGPHSPGMRIFGDHVRELQDGGAPLDKANVMLRCGRSHSRKTMAARAARMLA